MTINKEVKLTKNGYEELNEERRKLIDEELPQVIEQLQAARAMGDLSENADYSAAKDRQAVITSRIKEIESLLNNAEVVVANKKDKSVGMGKVVTIKKLKEKKTLKVLMVSTEEASAYSFDGEEVMKISTDSPLGQALIGHKTGDVVTVKANNPYDAEIVDIEIK